MKLTQKQIKAALLTNTTDKFTRVTVWPDHITVMCGSKADRDAVIRNVEIMCWNVQNEHYVNRAWNVYIGR